VFIGRQGRDIAESEAASYIAGYTIFNDFSARDMQLREMQGRLGPAKGKDFDTGNVMGPWLVTPEEIADPYALTMTARVNGEEWSRASTGDLHFTLEEIIAYISRDETLYPGDFIGAGTAPGGCGLELDRWIQAGDVVELEVEGLGVLRNEVSRQDAKTPGG
jgi:2-keto-4-pentenoate hydratase/2-oxohepta-3-ene-1,7-dioic acid hydratase in catechol pathway